MTLTPWDVLADGFDPQPFDERTAWGPLGYTPNPGPQTELHATPLFAHGGPWDLLYGGAMGGGKTIGLVFDAILKAAEWRGLEVWYVRATYPELERDVLPVLERVGFAQAIGARWNGSDRTLRLPNGSRVRFLHSRNTLDAASIRGECQYLIVDERTLIDPRAVELLMTRVRSGDPSVPIVGVRSASNPGGYGHSSVKRDFIDPAPLGRVMLPVHDEHGAEVRLDDGRRLERFYLPARISDNPRLDSSYRARFAMMSPAMQAAYRDGDWSQFEGMRFPDFSLAVHVVRPEELSLDLEGLKRGIGVDVGSTSPFAAMWGAIIGDNQLVVYREAHEAGLTSRQQARRIIELSTDAEMNGHTPPVWIDPESFGRNPEQPTVTKRPDRPPPGSQAGEYLAEGLPVRRAHNVRIAGWAMVDEILQIRSDGEPGLYIYNTCPNLIRSLSGAPRDEIRPEDVDHRYRDDHAIDAFRYLVMGMLGGPRRREPMSVGTGRRAASMVIPTGVR